MQTEIDLQPVFDWMITQGSPHKVYVENVRSILKLTTNAAQALCDAAVRDGVLESGVELRSLDGSVIATANSEAGFPQTVTCWEQVDGHLAEVDVDSNQLTVVTYFWRDDSHGT